MAGSAPSGVKAHVDWITASAGVRQGRPAPEERSRGRPLAWKDLQHAAVQAAEQAAEQAAVQDAAVEPVAVALWHHADWLKKRCLGL